jgi:mevalonate kinase
MVCKTCFQTLRECFILISSSVISSAPANTMLMGEHAVLYGHSALVCALTQRIYIKANKRPDGLVVVESQLGYFECPLVELEAQLDQSSPFSFVLQALVCCELNTGLHLVIESDFEHMLGLGSSAAVTVATLGAIELLVKGKFDVQTVMRLGIESIRKVQGRGSGADVAASALGGIVKFQAKPLTANKVNLSAQAWQRAPGLRLVYCGYKTPTPVVIEQVLQAAVHDPKRFAQVYEQMGACVETTVYALNGEDWPIFAQLMDQYQNLMRDLGVSDKTIERIIELGQKQATNGALFGAKISGSGLGDCVLLLGCEPLDWPHVQMSVQIDPQGLRQENYLPSQAPYEKPL